MRLVIASHKGGVGKTTISLNLAVSFAELGYRTLLVDGDPQGALNLALGKGYMELKGLSDVLSQKTDLAKAIVKTNKANLSFLAKGGLAAQNTPQFEMAVYDDARMSPIMEEVQQHCDICVIDTPAGLGMITRGLLRHGTHVVVPFLVDYLNLRSMNQVLEVIDNMQAKENPDLEFLGFVLNQFDRISEDSFHIAGEVWRDIPRVLDTTIPRVGVFARASRLGVPLAFLSKRKHPEARRFEQLAEELIGLIEPQEVDDDSQVQQLL